MDKTVDKEVPDQTTMTQFFDYMDEEEMEDDLKANEMEVIDETLQTNQRIMGGNVKLNRKKSPNFTRTKKQSKNKCANTITSKHPNSKKGRKNVKANGEENEHEKKTPLKKQKHSTTRLRENKSQTTPSRSSRQNLIHSPAPSPQVKRNAKGETALHLAAIKASLFTGAN